MIKKLLSTNSSVLDHILPVIYSSSRVDIPFFSELITDLHTLQEDINAGGEYSGQYELNYILPLFLVKGKQWEYEREWRLIYSKIDLYNDPGDIFETLTVDFDCVTAVYMGYKIDNDIKEYLSKMCKRLIADNKQIKLYNSKLGKNEYSIEFSEVELG